jgi:hypothetical protein
MFKPTYLYIKTHNTTGLKYFGKTITDPNTYKGSGTVWTRHIKKHGYDVTTEILGYYTDKQECLTAAVEFSNSNNIVESKEWANLRLETLDGGDTSKTENYLKYLPTMSSYRKKCKWWNNGSNQVFTPEPPDTTYQRGRLSFNNVGAKLGAEINSSKFWVNNGKSEIMIFKTDPVPAGYIKGRLLTKAFNGYDRSSAKGVKWWNNGKQSKMARECPGVGYTEGRLKI